MLVEGRTEKLTLPLVFDALGVDPDKEGILVLECGGKGNMPLFARVANACSVPYVVVHDRDAPRGVRPVESERVVNRQIREIAGSRRTVVLTPDFETVSGLRASNPRPQAAEGVAALPRQRRGARAAARGGREGPEDRADRLVVEAAAAGARAAGRHLVRAALELVRQRLE